jgi:hypothetical protein
MFAGRGTTKLAGCLALWIASNLRAADDPANPPNPFGDTRVQRTDAVQGAIHLSDGTVVRGEIYLTRGHDLRIYDASREEYRDVPLRVVSEVTCDVEREWIEREWRFKENGNDEKIYTGRTYPARIYAHEIRLTRGDVISGPVSAVVYILPRAEDESGDSDPAGDAAGPVKPLRFLLHKRDKGDAGDELADLVYVQRIVLGDAAQGEKSDSDDVPAPAHADP